MAPHFFKTLDGIRCVAACIVMIWHSSDIFGFRPGSGYLAVDFFFCVSGFVLAYAYGNRLSGAKFSWQKFMLLRLIRIYPLYMLSLLVMIASIFGTFIFNINTNWTLAEIKTSFLFSLFFLPTPPLHSEAVFPLNNPAWSLFFELIANFVYAFFIKQLNNSRLRLIIVIAAIFLVISALSDGSLNHGGDWATFSAATPRVFYSFFLGVYLQRLDCKLNININPIIILLSSAIILSIDPGRLRMIYDLNCVLFLFPLLIISGSNSEPQEKLSHVFWILGSTSYTLYVLHVPVTAIIEGILNKLYGRASAPMTGVGILLLLIIMSLIVNYYYDNPVRKKLGNLMKN